MVLAFVLLDSPRLPSAEALIERLRTRTGSRYRLEPDADDQSERMTTTLRIDGEQALIGLMPTSVPWGDLEGPCATNRFWPEAAEVCSRHTAHLVVALREGDDEALVTRHVQLTDLVAAIVEEVEAPAVYWGAGTLVHSRERFLKFATDAGPDDLPLFLWIDFRILRRDDGSLFIATTGLEALGLMEFEGVSRSLKPGELLGKVFDLAYYVCRNGHVLNDGDTVGANAEERIRVTYGPSEWERAKVIRIHFDGEEKRSGLGGCLAGLFGRRRT